MHQRRWGPLRTTSRPANQPGRLVAGWRVLSVALLIATLIGAVSTVPLSAQEPPVDPVPTEETRPNRDPSTGQETPTEVVEPTREPAPEPTVAPTEPVVEPTVEPAPPEPTAEDPIDEGPAPEDQAPNEVPPVIQADPDPQEALGDPRITVIASDCSLPFADEAEFQQADPIKLQLDCPRRQNIPFEISTDAFPSPNMVTNVDGVIEWFDISVENNQAVTVFLPSEYVKPRVFCNYNGGGLVELVGLEVADLGDDDYLIYLSTNKEELDICSYFLMQRDPEEPDPSDDFGDVLMHKYDCSGEFTADELGGAGFDALFAACPVMPGIIFGITPDGAPSPIQETDASGDVLWTDVPAGDVSVFEAAQSGFGAPVVFCRRFDVDAGTFEAIPADVAVSNGGEASITFPLGPHEFIECDWFNGRVTESVQVDKFDCSGILDADFAYDLTLAGLINAGCPRMPGVEFTLTSGGDNSIGITNADGIVSWDGVETGDVTITETAPGPGFGKPIVWCNFAQQTVQLGSVSLELVAETGIGCFWWNIPADDQSEGTVIVHKRLCAPQVAVNDLTIEELQAACTPQGGVEFTIDPQNPGNPPQIVLPNPGVTDLDGEIVWADNVPAGEVTLTEEALEGIGTPLVFCANSDGVEGFVALDGLSVTQTLPAGGLLVCEWFNPELPIETRVIVFKGDCPAGVQADALATVDDALAACGPEGTEGVQFQLDTTIQPDSPAPELTNSDGLIFWGNIWANQDILIAENVPVGFGDPVVFCQDGDGFSNPAPFELMEVGQSASIETALTPAGKFCAFFNIVDAADVAVAKTACPAGVDAADLTTLGDALAACPQNPHEGVEFTIDPDIAPNPQNTDANGFAVWEAVPVGEVTLTETIPLGFVTPVVFCLDGLAIDPAATPDTVTDGAVTFDLAAGGKLCHWFNIPLTLEIATQNVTVFKWLCPAGTQSTDFQDLDAALAGCTTAQEGVEFTLTPDTAPNPQLTAGDPATAFWEGVLVGPVTIAETIPAGHEPPFAYCQDGLAGEGDVFPVEVVDGAVSVQLTQLGLFCHFFNIPVEQEDEGARVVVHKWLCPEGTDATNLSVAEIAATCIVPQPGIEFTLTPDVAPNPQVTNNAGVVSWGEVPAGDVTITETLPAGFEPPAVVCEDANSIGFEDVDAAPSISHPVLDGESLICEWYNIPTEDEVEDDGSQIIVYKWDCPVAYDGAYEATLDELLANCVNPHNGVDFHLIQGNSDIEDTTVDGEASWDDVETGPFTLDEEIPAGYGDPLVDCRWAATDDGLIVHGASPLHVDPDGVHSDELSFDNTTYVCNWFNVPYDDDDGDTSRVQVDKFDCGDAISAEEAAAADLATLQATCPSAMAGVEFTLDPDVQPNPQETDANGQVAWGPVEPGQVTITETIPDGYYQPVVFCDDGDGVYEPYIVTGGAVSHDLAPSTLLICKWFNLTGDHGDEIPETGQLFITKYACPVDYDAANASIAELQTDCGNTLLEGVRFVVAPDAAPAPVQFTNQGGEVFWFDIPAGQITVTETIPAGYAKPVVFCDVNGSGLYTDETVTNGSITRPLGADETVACEWFNTSVSDDNPGKPGDPGDDPVITNFPDTGTGPLRAPGAASTDAAMLAAAALAVLFLALLRGGIAAHARTRR